VSKAFQTIVSIATIMTTAEL